MLHPDALKMLYFINFINTESDRNPDTRPLSEIARSTIFKAHPDGLCISANAAGQDVDDALIASVKQAAPEVAVLCQYRLPGRIPSPGSCPKFGFNRYVSTTQLKITEFSVFFNFIILLIIILLTFLQPAPQ